MVMPYGWIGSPLRYRAALVAIAAASAIAASPAPASPPTQAPTGLHATAVTARTIAVAWELPSDPALGTTLWLSGPPNIGGGFLLAPGSSDFTLTGLTCGSTYVVTAAYRNDQTGETGPTTAVSQATTACTGPPPSAPTGLQLIDATGSTLTFGWDPPADADVEWIRTSITGPPFVASQNDFTPSTLAWTMPGLVCGTTYPFAMFFVDAEGQWSPTASMTAGTQDCLSLGEPPPGPSELRVPSATAVSAVVEWDKPADPAVTRTRVTVSSPGRVKDSWLGKTLTTATVSTPACGTVYRVAVSWLFPDGRLSTPATTVLTTPPCPLPPGTSGSSPTGPTVGARPPAGPQVPARKVSIALQRRSATIRVARSGRFTIPGARVACPADGGATCIATVTITTRKTAAKTTRLGTTRLTIAPGTTARLTAKLSRNGQATLRRRRQLKTIITIEARRQSAQVVRRFMAVTLRAPRT
jgi:hypothetical protein